MDKRKRRAERDESFLREIEERQIRQEEEARRFDEMVSYRGMFDDLPFDKDDCILNEFGGRATKFFDSKPGRFGYMVKIDGNEITEDEHELVTKVIYQKLFAISAWCRENGIDAGELAEDELDWQFDQRMLQNRIPSNPIRRKGVEEIVVIFAIVADGPEETALSAISEFCPRSSVRDQMMRIRYRIDQIVLKNEIECVRSNYTRSMSVGDAQKLFGVSRNQFMELVANGQIRVGKEFMDGDSTVRVHLEDMPSSLD